MAVVVVTALETAKQVQGCRGNGERDKRDSDGRSGRCRFPTNVQQFLGAYRFALSGFVSA